MTAMMDGERNVCLRNIKILNAYAKEENSEAPMSFATGICVENTN